VTGEARGRASPNTSSSVVVAAEDDRANCDVFALSSLSLTSI
jgi:hypothetical protein